MEVGMVGLSNAAIAASAVLSVEELLELEVAPACVELAESMADRDAGVPLSWVAVGAPCFWSAEVGAVAAVAGVLLGMISMHVVRVGSPLTDALRSSLLRPSAYMRIPLPIPTTRRP